MKKLYILIPLLLLAYSCAERVPNAWDKDASSRKNEQIIVQRLHHDYWNDVALREKKIKDCGTFFLPDFFPLQQNQKFIYKLSIPGDTIFFLNIIRNAIQENTFVEYKTDKTLTGQLQQNRRIMAFPLVAGLLIADSNLQLKWDTEPYEVDALSMEDESYKSNPLYLDACMSTSDAVITGKEKKESWEIQCLGSDSLVVSSAKKAYNQLENNIALRKEFTGNEEAMRQQLQVVMDSVIAASTVAMEITNTTNILKLRIWDKSKADKAQAFTLWFQRGTGLVKLLEESTGITLELVEY